MDWNELRGQTIEDVFMEADLEWAKQNGLLANVYMRLKSGKTVTLSIKEDNSEPYPGPYIVIEAD